MIYLLIMLLSAFDAAATWLGVTRYGIEEGNAIARLMFGWSVPGTCALALLVTAVALWAIRTAYHRYGVRWAVWAVWGVLAVKIAIVLIHVQWLVLI